VNHNSDLEWSGIRRSLHYITCETVAIVGQCQLMTDTGVTSEDLTRVVDDRYRRDECRFLEGLSLADIGEIYQGRERIGET
jgi:hypothetical protein